MTGVVIISAEEGQKVEAGQQLGVMEAMKMEPSIGAPIAGTVERVAVSSGTNVEPGDLPAIISP